MAWRIGPTMEESLANAGLATASLELEPVLDQSQAAAQTVPHKPGNYGRRRGKSAMTIGDNGSLSLGAGRWGQTPALERAVSVHPRYAPTPARRRWNAEKRCRRDNKWGGQPRWRKYLRLTEVPGGETHEELRDPCSAGSAEVCRRAPIVNVFNADRESSAS